MGCLRIQALIDEVIVKLNLFSPYLGVGYKCLSTSRYEVARVWTSFEQINIEGITPNNFNEMVSLKFIKVNYNARAVGQFNSPPPI